MSQFDFAPHSHQCAYSSARAAATHRTKPEFRQNASDVFTVKAPADHNCGLRVLEAIGRRNHATVPETPYAVGRTRFIADTLRFEDDREAQSGADQPDV